jgi:hypothetical protein
MLDMALCSPGDDLAILVASVNPNDSPKTHYAIGIIHVALSLSRAMHVWCIRISRISVPLRFTRLCLVLLGILSMLSDEPPAQFKRFHVVNHTTNWSGDESSSPPSLRLLMHGANFAYAYDHDSVLCCSLTATPSPDEAMERIDFSSFGNCILGTGVSESGAPFLFTANQGLLAVSPSAQLTAQAGDVSHK